MQFVFFVSILTFLPPILTLVSTKIFQNFFTIPFLTTLEAQDRFNFIFVLLFLLFVLFIIDPIKPTNLRLNNRNKFLEVSIGVLVVFSFSFLFFQNDIRKENYRTLFWNGFNHDLIPIFIFIFILTFLFTDKLNILLIYIKLPIKIFSFLIVIYFFLNSIQFENSELDTYHYLFTLNELASPSSGFYPPFNYKTQYSNLFGYVHFMFPTLFESINSYYIYVNILNFISIILALYILKFFSTKFWYLCVILCAPTFIVRGDLAGESIGSIFTFTGSFPLRFLPILLFGLLALWKIKKHSHIVDLLIYAFTFLLLINNPETGIVGLISLLTVLIIHFGFRNIKNFLFKVIIFQIAGLIVVAIFSSFFFNTNFLDNWLFFVLRFGGGFYSLNSNLFGLHNLLFGLALTSILIARKNIRLNDINYPSHIIVIFMAVQIVMTSPYYFNRSSYTGQLQFIYVLSIFTFLYILINLYNFNISFHSNLTRKLLLSFVVVAMIIPIFQSPNIQSTFKRLEKSNLDSRRFQPIIKEIDAFVELNNLVSSSFYLAINNGNLISLESNYKSIIPQNSIDDLVPNLVDGRNYLNFETCNELISLRSGYLLMEKYNGIYSQYKDNYILDIICDLDVYEISTLGSNTEYSVFKLKDAT